MSSRCIGMVAVAVAAAATITLTGCEDAKEPAADPKIGTSIRISPEHGGVLVVQPAEAFSDGLEVVEVIGSRPIEIVDAGLLGASDGLEFLGASLSFQEGGTVAHQYLVGYPPADKDLGRVVQAEGTELEPMDEAAHPPELLIGMKVGESGVFEREAIYIDYVEDGERYRAVIPARLAVCTKDVASTVEQCSALANH